MAIVPAKIMSGFHCQICGCPAPGSSCKLGVELGEMQAIDGGWQRCDLQGARNPRRSQRVEVDALTWDLGHLIAVYQCEAGQQSRSSWSSGHESGISVSKKRTSRRIKVHPEGTVTSGNVNDIISCSLLIRVHECTGTLSTLVCGSNAADAGAAVFHIYLL